MRTGWSRRGFLALGGGLVVTLGSGCSLVPPIPKRPAPDLEAAAGWLQLDAQGRWRLWSPRMEMGQGVHEALRRVAAGAIGITPRVLRLMPLRTTDLPLVKATVGSDSMRELVPLLEQAGAGLRARVLAQGAGYLGVPPQALVLEDRAVRAPDGRRLALRDLVAQAGWAGPAHREPVTVADEAAAAASFDGERDGDDAGPATLGWQALLFGTASYAADVRLPGMLHAAVLHPPQVGELPVRLLGWAEERVRSDPACVVALRLPALAGPAVVAAHPQALIRLRTLAEPQWETAPARDVLEMVDVDRMLAAGRSTRRRGRVDDGPWTVDLRLDVPLAAHAAIEPRCAVASFERRADGPQLDVWCGTQDPYYVRDVLARDHGLPPQAVRVHAMRLGGGFGARTIATVEREAAHLARALGRPVKLQWTREDEFRAGFHRPPSSHRVRVRLDGRGRIAQWWHALSSSHVLFTNAGLPPWMQRLTDLVGDGGTVRGQNPPYDTGRTQLDLTLTRLPVYTGPWRGLGAGPNVLAIELAMDAAARASGQDPLAFRLAHLGAGAGAGSGERARLAAVLRRLAAVMGAAPLAAGPGGVRARGLACGTYKAHSHAAAAAEVELRMDDDGRVRDLHVTRLWCVHDCGRVIDADGVRAQVEGNLVWCLGMVLHERLAAPGGVVEPAQFGAYALPRLPDVPPMHIELMDSDAPPAGAGETAMVAGAGAIANAVAAAWTLVHPGQPPRRWWTLPLTPETLALA